MSRVGPRQDALDRMARLRKSGFWAHLNRARSGNENESADGFGRGGEKRVWDTRLANRRQYSAEEKIRIVVAGRRGEDSLAALCRKQGINQNLYYHWSNSATGKLEIIRLVEQSSVHGSGGSLSVREGLARLQRASLQSGSKLERLPAHVLPQSRHQLDRRII